MNISVVIPTCNRKQRLLSLLEKLDDSDHPLLEVIVVDSGEDAMTQYELSGFKNIRPIYITSEKSVCIQRNIGIRTAAAEWIFLCDDDIEPPADYISKLVNHIKANPNAGAVSGLVLQKEKDGWESTYPVKSARNLLWRYIFRQSIWGEIQCPPGMVTEKIKHYYSRKGNHIARSGWPVITHFSGDCFVTPVYGLGASLVKRDWLLASPYDEVLDRHGIGDNYGVATGFPLPEIHVCNHAFVYHHQAAENRLAKASQYFRRVLALDYFRRTNARLSSISKTSLLWSLTGNLLSHTRSCNFLLLKATLKAMRLISFNRNPYALGAARGLKSVHPEV